jgi:hypothetical protein
MKPNIEYWKSLCPDLHINDSEFQKKALDFQFSIPTDTINALKKYSEQFYFPSSLSIIFPIIQFNRRLCEDGYFQLGAQELKTCFNNLSIPKLAKSITTIVEKGHPASYINLFDEPWIIALRIGKIMENVSHNKINMDMLSWYS